MRPLLSLEEVEALLYGLGDELGEPNEPMLLRIELGRAHLPTVEFLQLGVGSVIDFPQRAEEPCEVWVNHKLVAYGEMVVTDNHYGIRITELLPSMERASRHSDPL